MKSFMNISARALVFTLCMLLLCPPQMVLAASPVPVAGTSTTVSTAGNGVPVVNIAAPNASGLSHNTYTSYNVDAQGLVLNNGDISQFFRQSQLAGQVAANPNLVKGQQAQFILNEVTSTNPTTLAGFTEVLGGKASVIVANPNGITCAGCGFLNTDRVSLVTGNPNFVGGALSTFTVNGGELLISGTGLNASAQQILDLVSRKITIDGKVNTAGDLNLTAGRNTWDYAAGTATPLGAAAGAPAYGIDSSLLGGMYAGKITLKATEAGVGVRLLGDAAATADDFTITSAGKIDIRSKVSSGRDLALTSASTGADAINLTDANLTAARNLGLTASLGGATISGGGLVATGNLTLLLASLSDISSLTAGITDANKRYAGGAFSLTTTGAWTMDGIQYGSGGAFNANVGSFVRSGANSYKSGGTLDITTATGNLALAASPVQSAGDMHLTATTGEIVNSSGAGQGVQSTAGNITLTAARDITNVGTITADTGDITVRTNGALLNAGTMRAFGAFSLRDRSGGRAVNLSLPGGKILSATTDIGAGIMYLGSGASVESTGNMAITVNTLTLGDATDSTPRILAAGSGTGTGTVTIANAFTNYGLMFSGQDLIVTAPSITNTSTGAISALNDATVRATGGDLLNQGLLYAGRDLTASATGTFTNDGTVNAALGNLSSGRNMSLTAPTFINSGSIDSSHDITISAATFKNEVKGGDTRTWGALSARDQQYTGGDHWGCGPLDVDTCFVNYFKDVWTQSQYYAGGTPTYHPTISGGSGGTVTIKDFNTGANTGGTISGDTIVMTGNAGATFTNTSLTRGYRTMSQTYRHYWERWAIGDGPDRWDSYSAITTVDSTTGSLFAARIKANTLVATGFALSNEGSPYTPAPTSRSATGTAFPGLVLTMPANPNGLFVPAVGSSSSYLVETNPQYTNLDNFLGSNYLEKTYGLNPDKTILRLGDAGYETYLVSQQLATQTGSKLLAGYANEKEQMKGLMDNAGTQAKDLGLSYGQALSPRQQANLKEDMIWMVETVVNGKTVLAPVVYLAASTKDMFDTGGAVIAAKNTTMNLTSLSNTGGTIAGSNTLNVTTQGDITNTSGTITGGNVKLTSTEGSIVNKTLVETTGDDKNRLTTVGKQAGITATGNLDLNAAKDITNLGAKVAAGGDASLTAGRNVTFDTVENKTAYETHFGDRTNSNTRTTEQIRSELSSGGNLAVKSGNDVTLAGTNVNAGGNAAIDAGNNLNILARDNVKEVTTVSEKEGFGLNGALFSKEKTTTDTYKSTAVGTNIASGGNLSLSAGNTATLVGANVASGGDTSISATDVQIMAAKEVDRTTTTKTTESILSISAPENDGQAPSTSSGALSKSGGGMASAGAKASASSTKDGGGLDFSKKNTTTTADQLIHSVGSTIATGKNLTITSKKDITLEGAQVKAKGDTSLTGENVNVLTAQDVHTSSRKSETTKVGLYVSSTNTADASAGTKAGVSAAPGSASAGSSAGAQAAATTSNNLDFVRSKTTETNTTDVTNTGTTLASGGTLKINTAKTLTVQGSDVSGDQGVDVKAKDMQFLAAQDTHDTSTSTTKTSAGLYLDGKATADASAKAGADASLGANAGANAKADVSIGIQTKNTTASSAEGSSTARVSSITSKSGSITRTAENSITDVGTNIDAAGDFSQSAKTITSKAAANTTYATDSSVTNTAKIGVYAKAEAGVNADAGAQAGAGGADAGAKVEATAKVGAGIRASYARDESSSSSSTSDAVVSTIKSGGKITSASTEKTSLEGTQISGGKGVELSAGSLDYSAAKNTTSSSSAAGNVNGSASVGISRGSGKGVDVDVAGGTSSDKSTSATSTAVAGGISSGGDLVIKTTGDTRLEGTNLGAAGDTAINTGGNLTFDAARNTSSSTSNAYDASASLSVGKSSGGGGSSKSGFSAAAEGGSSQSSSSTSDAVAGSIGTGGKLTITSGKSASFEGTNIGSGGDATISAKDTVSMTAARSTATSESSSVRVGVEAGGGKSTGGGETSTTKSGGVDVGVTSSKSSSSTAQGGSVSSGGNLKIASGKDTNFEGTDLSAANKATVQAGGSVNFKAAESTSESSSVGVSVSGKAQRTNTRPTPAGAPKPTASKPANPGTGGTQGSDGSAQSNADLAKWQGKQGAVNQELKDKFAGATGGAGSGAGGGTGGSGASGSGTSGTGKTPPAPPSGPKPLSPTLTAGSTGTTGGAAKGAFGALGGGTGAGGAGLDADAIRDLAGSGGGATGQGLGKGTGVPVSDGTTTSSKTSGAVGVGVQNSSSTTQKAGSIRSGAGGVEITADGGDVNLVGTGISTTGDAAISAARDVNISATRNTSSSVGVGVSASVDHKNEQPAAPAAKPTAATGGKSGSGSGSGGSGSGGGSAQGQAVSGVYGMGQDAGEAGNDASRYTRNKGAAIQGSVGVGVQNSSTSQGANIQTGGRTVITSGGKTTLTNTKITADEGQSIDAAGGVERKTEKNSSFSTGGTMPGGLSD